MTHKNPIDRRAYDKARDATPERQANKRERENKPRYKATRGAYNLRRRKGPRGARILPRELMVSRAIELLGKRCVHCGETEVTLLQIDHIVPLAAVGTKRPRFNARAVVEHPAPKTEFQLLCYPCHKRKTRADMTLIVKRRRSGETAPVPAQSCEPQLAFDWP